MGETQKRGIKGGNEIKLGLIEKKTGSFVRERGENNQMKFFLQEFALIQTEGGQLGISDYSKFPISLPRAVYNSLIKLDFCVEMMLVVACYFTPYTLIITTTTMTRIRFR